MIRDAPELEAQAHSEHLAEGGGGEIEPGLLGSSSGGCGRGGWRRGRKKEVFFTRDHPPGRTLAVAGTDPGGEGSTIQRESKFRRAPGQRAGLRHARPRQNAFPRGAGA